MRIAAGIVWHRTLLCVYVCLCVFVSIMTFYTVLLMCC
jgi:hypothetical protein